MTKTPPNDENDGIDRILDLLANQDIALMDGLKRVTEAMFKLSAVVAHLQKELADLKKAMDEE